VKLPRSTQNWATLAGATIALIALFMAVFLFTVTLIAPGGYAYLGLVIYILLPSVMFVGLILIPVGMILQIRKDKKAGKGEAPPPWPLVDLNNIRHRNAFFVFSGGTVLLLFASAIGSYEAFHFTESVVFCGTLCHSVMHPEYTAYQNSPHARVACVGCHVGPGAGWYVRSKLSGLYQVYSVTFKKYSKPIPTPIENLRPARETCEECHWPQKFYAQKMRLESHYMTEGDSTQWDIYLLMKIGAQHSALGLSEGIHWHINPDVRIEYAGDQPRQKLPWVRYTNRRTGATRVYRDKESPPAEGEVRTGEIRTMDCMDCHTRPSHDYRAPTLFINNAITAGDLPRELPQIKSVATELCAKEYESTEAALEAIEQGLHDYYRTNHAELYAARKDLVDKAAEGVRGAFNRNIFPDMKVRWSAYPNHIGHLEFNGCFRCHNDKHVADDGKTISRDCNLCHWISAQGKPGDLETALIGQKLEFRHPEDIGDSWKEMLCTDCHTGVTP
jgi:hypothetical protein